MIQVKRATKPVILQKNEARWKIQIRSASTERTREKAQSKYRHSEIRETLSIMFHGKCAYCESRIDHIAYPHIEHFKPKADPMYYELAVDWENLLLACGKCNGPEYKGAKFPNESEGGPFINPVEENPADHLKFDFDRKIKLANVLWISKRGETTCKELGLNRSQLVLQRSSFVRKLWALAQFYTTNNEARRLIDKAVGDDEEYAAFARELLAAIKL